MTLESGKLEMAENERVLVVDDEEDLCRVLEKVLNRSGYEVDTATNGSDGIKLAEKYNYAVAIVDQNMPEMSGLETIRRLTDIDPDIAFIVYTGHPTIDSSIEALHENVFDYLRKPMDMKSLIMSVRRASERRNLLVENRKLMRQLENERDGLRRQVEAAKRAIEQRLESSTSFIGRSDAIRQVRHFMAEVSPSDMTVLLLGESGVGKDVVSRLIHEASGRDPNAFVKINCPAIPETLLESELFGHEPGAFTGAERRKPGRFELASHGTIFLDEIGDLPIPLQAKLLQVIEQKQFTRLGGSQTIRVDVRIIAATNASLPEMIAQGKFRADLFYRLNEYAIEIPPLRTRKDDIALLVQHFLNIYGQKYNHENLTVSEEAMRLLMEYDWPGNVRELESVIRRYALDVNENTIRAALRTSNSKIAPAAYPVDSTPVSSSSVAAPSDRQNTASGSGGPRHYSPPPSDAYQESPRANSASPQKTAAEILRETEIQTILGALRQTRWNQRQAAEMLGMSYSSLRRRISKYDLKNHPL
ncbi:MAG: sigma-54-dependent transcriptional regulator [Candidatus Sumerlaeia bacterium]